MNGRPAVSCVLVEIVFRNCLNYTKMSEWYRQQKSKLIPIFESLTARREGMTFLCFVLIGHRWRKPDISQYIYGELVGNREWQSAIGRGTCGRLRRAQIYLWWGILPVRIFERVGALYTNISHRSQFMIRSGCCVLWITGDPNSRKSAGQGRREQDCCFSYKTFAF